MSNAAASPIGPDAPDALRPEFRIEGEFALRAVLRELMARRALVTLYPEGRIDDALVTHIVHVGPEGIELDATGQPGSAAALHRAGFVIGVAFPGSVKTQFRLERLSPTDEAPLPTAAGAAAATVARLQAPLPTELYRLQRREAFRVPPPPGDDAHCVQHVGAGRELRHPLVDLSANGLAILLLPGSAAPAPGRIWRHSRIETAVAPPIPCELIVRGVYPDPEHEDARRVAFAFQAMPSEILRRIQVYVIDIEKRLHGANGGAAAGQAPRPACS